MATQVENPPPWSTPMAKLDGRVSDEWRMWFARIGAVLPRLTANWTTAGRPTTELYVGRGGFNTTLGTTEWWDGSAWVHPHQMDYGEIYAEGNSVETAIAVQNTWYQVTIFNANGQGNGATPDHTNDHITIATAGVYKVMVSLSLLSAAGPAFTLEGEVKTENGTTACPNIHFDRDLGGGGGDVGSASMSGMSAYSEGETVEVWVRNKSNTTNVIIEDVNLTVVQV